MRRIVLRCDGDEMIGSGHVSRCLGIARALVLAGDEPLFVGRYRGLAAALLTQAGVATADPGEGPAGIPAQTDAALVDSYTLAAAEVEAAAERLPLAVISDGGRVPPCRAVLTYHVDHEVDAATDAAVIVGPRYAPVDARCAAARRPRGLARGLITLGGAGDPRLHDQVMVAAQAVAADEVVSVPDGRSPVGLAQRLAWCDFAVSGAGFTPYELVCAGVPSLVLAMADNQAPVALALAAGGLAVALDARRRLDERSLAEALDALRDPRLRDRVAVRGPATVDGYGAFRARDALRAAWEGKSLPDVLGYRPACGDDADLLLEWRNDPASRAASRERRVISPERHERWLREMLDDDTRVLSVIEDERAAPIGTVRFDITDDEAQINLTLAPERRAQGLGRIALRQASELVLASRPWLRRVVADVREENRRSMRAFESAGFEPEARPAEGWVRLALTRRHLVRRAARG